MIEDVFTARKISDLMLDISDRLNESLALVREKCPLKEFEEYRGAVGAIMSEILLEVLNPLYSKHPQLKPPGLD